MVISDTLAAKLKVELTGTLARAMGTGGHTGTDVLNHSKTQSYTDGDGANQASGWLSTKGTVTEASITINLADEADPTAGIGSDTPTSDPDETKLRAIMIENLDTTNYIKLGLGSSKITEWIEGTTPTIRIHAGAIFVQTFPAGIPAGKMTYDTDDEITLQAVGGACVCKISYLFG